MTQVVLNINDDSKLTFILKWLKQFDFIDIKSSLKANTPNKDHDIFASAGMWENRDIDLNELRKSAWKRSL